MDRRRSNRFTPKDAALLRLFYSLPEPEYVPLCDPRRLGACPCGESGEAACAICAGREDRGDREG